MKGSSSEKGGGLSGHDTASSGGDTGTGAASGGGLSGHDTASSPSSDTGAGSSSSGAASGASGRMASEGTAATNQVWGKVEKFDPDAKTLSLEDSDKKLKVTDQTRISKEGSAIPPSLIKEGDEVRASYSGSGDADVVEVTAIEVMPEPGAAPAPSDTGSGGRSGSMGTGSSGSTGTGSSGSTGTDSSSGAAGGSSK
jgi:hypothetical protein